LPGSAISGIYSGALRLFFITGRMMTNNTEVKKKKIDFLKVTGTTLYYEIRGQGPVLLMIPAGGGDAQLNGIKRICELPLYYDFLHRHHILFSRQHNFLLHVSKLSLSFF
jgi:hypothetical protein